MAVEDTAENAERCVCPTCPSYNDCMRNAGELLYCSRAKSSCEVATLSCVCASCTVWRNNELAGLYFCMAGAAR